MLLEKLLSIGDPKHIKLPSFEEDKNFTEPAIIQGGYSLPEKKISDANLKNQMLGLKLREMELKAELTVIRDRMDEIINNFS